MTALERARQANPELRPDFIIRFGCPGNYRVGKEPYWCDSRDKAGKTCTDCWNQQIDTEGKACGWCQECETCKEISRYCTNISRVSRKIYPSDYDIMAYEIYDIASKTMYIGFQLDISRRFIGKFEDMKYASIKDRDPEELLRDVVQRVKKAR